MSLSSAATTDDAEGDEGSSRGFSSLPSTSESSTNAPTSQSGRYPESLSATGAAHKSAKLETFDELLREAGYQHTRVLTPKGERVGKDDATYSASAGSGEHSQGLGEIKSYVMTVTGLLAWLGGRSTTATTDPAMEASESTPDNAYKGNRSAIDPHDARLSRSPSPTSHRNRNSAQRLLPSINHIPSSPTSSSNHFLPSSSSNITLTPSNYCKPSTIRPDCNRPSREASHNGRLNDQAVPQAASHSSKSFLSPTTTTPSPDETKENYYRDGTGTGSKGRRSPLPQTWRREGSSAALSLRSDHRNSRPDERMNHPWLSSSPLQNTQTFPRNGSITSMRPSHRSVQPRTDTGYRRKPATSLPASTRPKVRREPSERLLARNGSFSKSKGRPAQAATPVTVVCRSSSVGPSSKSRKQRLPCLTPSKDTASWPWNGEQHAVPPLPKLNIHAANNPNALRAVGRTSSSSSVKAFSSYSRGSGYTSISRVGSAYTTLSRSGTGTSAMASSSRVGFDDSVWAEYGHSPTANGFKHRTPQAVIGETMQDTDEDSENEPRLSNILAPHVGSMSGVASAAPGRQASIQSLRACLQRHHSVSNGGMPQARSPMSAHFPQEGPRSPGPIPTLQVSPGQEEPATSTKSKRRSAGQYGSRNGKQREFDDDLFEQPLQIPGRCIERAGPNGCVEEVERGRQSTRGLLKLGINSIRWGPSSSSSAGRNSSIPASTAADHSKGRKGKMTEKEMERERLLWGTSWGRREMD